MKHALLFPVIRFCSVTRLSNPMRMSATRSYLISGCTYLLVATLSILFAACGSSPAVKPTGTYIRTSDTEVRILTDTIKIAPANSYSDNLYNITQSSATYFKNPKDSPFNKQKKPNTITGTLNPAKTQLETEDPGIVYSLSDDGRSISINGIVYQKVQ